MATVELSNINKIYPNNVQAVFGQPQVGLILRHEDSQKDSVQYIPLFP